MSACVHHTPAWLSFRPRSEGVVKRLIRMWSKCLGSCELTVQMWRRSQVEGERSHGKQGGNAGRMQAQDQRRSCSHELITMLLKTPPPWWWWWGEVGYKRTLIDIMSSWRVFTLQWCHHDITKASCQGHSDGTPVATGSWGCQKVTVRPQSQAQIIPALF